MFAMIGAKNRRLMERIEVSSQGSVREKILAYLSMEAARLLAGGQGGSFCDGCFTGRYPISIPEDQGKSRFEQPIRRGGKLSDADAAGK